MQKNLPVREWLSLAIVGGAILVVISQSFLKIRLREEEVLHLPEIEITIVGEVKKPGLYKVVKGFPLLQAILLARPTPWAHLEEEYGVAEGARKILITPIKEVEVILKGALLQEGSYFFPVGSRLCDIKDKIPLEKRADKSFFRKRRRLKHKEKITIPFKKSEK